ncbi:hypothetical protein N9L48_06055, partial [Psychrosphaera sp.]|nr:hypothetical protein [Psychrosphaera sp.]
GDADLTYCASETYELVAKRVKNASSIYETDFFMCEQLFNQKKIDILVDYEYNVPSYFERYPYEVFSESLPLFALFHDNERGRMLRTMFDNGLAKARRENKLSQHFLSFQDYKNARIGVTKVN